MYPIKNPILPIVAFFHQLARALPRSVQALCIDPVLLLDTLVSIQVFPFFAILIPQIVNTTTLKIMISKTIFMRSILHHLHHYSPNRIHARVNQLFFSKINFNKTNLSPVLTRSAGTILYHSFPPPDSWTDTAHHRGGLRPYGTNMLQSENYSVT